MTIQLLRKACSLLTFQPLVDVVFVVVCPVDVVQIHLPSLRHSVLRHVDGRVSVFILDELQQFSESKGSDEKPGRSRLNPGPVMDDASAPGQRFTNQLFSVTTGNLTRLFRFMARRTFFLDASYNPTCQHHNAPGVHNRWGMPEWWCNGSVQNNRESL